MKKRNNVTAIGFLLFSFFFSSLFGKTGDFTLQLIYQKSGASNGDFFGISIAGLGDINEDGISDFIVGSPTANPNGLNNAGSAFVYSGTTGGLIFRFDGPESLYFLGSTAGGIEDLNGDGTHDIIVGAPGASPTGLRQAGSVFVYSGADGALIYQKSGTQSGGIFGSAVGGTGDINGDGKADFIIGAADEDFYSGNAYIYSGSDGNLIYQIAETPINSGFGISADSLGDINGDNISDFIIGAYFATPDTFIHGGSAFVYSGSDTALIYRVNGTASDEYLGLAVAGIQDLSGDGIADFIVGAYLANPGGLNSTGGISVYSGSSGNFLYEKSGDIPNEWFGYSVTGLGDIDSDGMSDFVVGAPHLSSFIPATNPGRVYVYSGASGNLLTYLSGTDLWDGFGYSVANVGDLTGDGRNEFAFGVLYGDSARGSVYVYSFVPTDAPGEKQPRPNRFELSQNYPNPFNPTTTIRYFLPKRKKVTLEIFNLVGQRMRLLADGEQTAGEHAVSWNGKDEKGKTLPSGIYFYKLTGKDFTETKKMIFLK